MHNQNADFVRRSAREGAAVDFDDTWPGPTTATDPAAGLSLRDLDRALARIPEERRQVILLIGLEGASYEEAATILDVPIKTIRSRLSRGRESLRILMDRRDGTEPANGAATTSAPSNPKRFVPGFERTQNSRLCRCSCRRPGTHVSRLLQLTTPSVSGAPRPCRGHCHCGSSEHGAPDLALPAWFGARSPRSVPLRRGSRRQSDRTRAAG